jgi:hypothetical protein
VQRQSAANVLSFPGASTLRVSMARIDYAQNPPHTHPRATKIIYVTQGVLEMGFITTATGSSPRPSPSGKCSSSHGPASVIATFNRQLQGTQVIANTLFAAPPPVPSDVLAKAFRVANEDIDAVKARFK